MDNAKIMYFGKIYGKFKSGVYTLQDVSELVDIIWMKQVSLEAKETLLCIPLQILQIVELKMPATTFAHDNADYFSGNCVSMEKWKEFYKKGVFGLEDVCTHLEEIIESGHSGDSFLPRIAGVTIRDDVQVKDGYDLSDYSLFFAYLMERAFEL